MGRRAGDALHAESHRKLRQQQQGSRGNRVVVVLMALAMLVAAALLLTLRDRFVGEFEPVAELFVVDEGGRRVPLAGAALPEGGVELALEVQLNRPGFVYVFRTDAEGNETLLFPLPAVPPYNPFKAGSHRLPGDEPATWTVFDAGPGETILVVASAGKLSRIENRLHALPAEGPGIPARVPEPTIAPHMREMGGLPPADEADAGGNRAALRQSANKGVHLWEARRAP